jgi:hypothetical protein
MHNEELIRALQAERESIAPTRRVRPSGSQADGVVAPRVEPSLDSEGLIRSSPVGFARRQDGERSSGVRSQGEPVRVERATKSIGFVAKAQSGQLSAARVLAEPVVRKVSPAKRRGPAFTKPKKGWFSKFMDGMLGMLLGVNLTIHLALGGIFFYFVYRGLS